MSQLGQLMSQQTDSASHLLQFYVQVTIGPVQVNVTIGPIWVNHLMSNLMLNLMSQLGQLMSQPTDGASHLFQF